jgi:hypothetical protein
MAHFHPVRSKAVLILVACALGLFLRFPFLDEVPFIYDEALLLWQALEDNALAIWTTHGLRGTRGIDYGPVPILIYRFFFWMSRGIESVVFFKIAFTTALTAISLVGFFRLFPRIPKVASLLVCFSPYLWQYSRDLWDNSFNMPFSALLFCAFGGFLKTGKARYLWCACFFASLCLQVHLLCLPLVAACAICFLVYRWRWAVQHWPHTLAALAFLLIPLTPYLLHLSHSPQSPFSLPWGWGLFHGVYGFLGMRFFSSIGFEYFLGSAWYWPNGLIGSIGLFSVALTFLGVLPVWFGVKSAIAQWRSPHFEGEMAAFALIALALHIALVTFQQLLNHPHYYGSIWFAFFYLSAVGIASSFERFPKLTSAYFLGLGVSFLLAVVQAHHGAGLQSGHYGMPLKEQIRLAREANEAAAPEAPAATPQAVLRRLYALPR